MTQSLAGVKLAFAAVSSLKKPIDLLAYFPTPLTNNNNNFESLKWSQNKSTCPT